MNPLEIKPSQLMTEFSNLEGRLLAIERSLTQKLKSLLPHEALSIHSISSRVKSKESFRRKIARPDRTYRSLTDVTDIIGLRIVTYFEDSIEKIGQLIEKNFTVDFKNSTNKLRALDQERFGYRSMHYVCIDTGPEKIRFEIQIRTVLQHAWAEIEHDLGYKSPQGIPGVIRRRFSQVASILEIADREFVSIRRDVSAYQDSLKQTGVDRDQDIPLDLVSLKELLAHDGIKSLDQELAKVLNLPSSGEDFFPEYVLRALVAAEIKTVGEAFAALKKHDAVLPEFVPLYFKFAETALGLHVQSIETVLRGYSLLFIAHLSALDQDSLAIDKANRLSKFYEVLDFSHDVGEAVRVSRALVDTLQAAEFFRSATEV